MDLNNLAVIILAAGRGSRFGEAYTKLLHPIFEKPLIYYPIQNLKNLNVKNIFVVVSDPKVEEEVKKYIDCEFVYQDVLDGTGGAVKRVLDSPILKSKIVNLKSFLILNGDDATLYSKKTLDEFIKSHDVSRAVLSMMTLKTKRNMQVGRVIRDKKNNFSKILEYKEYLEEGIRSYEINCGVYLIDSDFLITNLPEVPKNDNGEYYITDLLNIAKEKSERINLYVLKNHSEWIGINDKKDLKHAENIIKKRHLTNLPKKIGEPKTVHFLGIAGSGTSACACIAKSEGFTVSGCDKNLSGEFTNVLKDIPTRQGHNPSHLEGVDILAVTPAVLSLDPNNKELSEAKKRKIKIMTWQQFLGKYLTQGKFVIAVCGTHGKSTTTAMIGKILEDLKLDPAILLGANVSLWNANFRIPNILPTSQAESHPQTTSLRSIRGGAKEEKQSPFPTRHAPRATRYFVIEADEFNDNFMSLTPDTSVVTNIEFDHPEYFKDFEDYKSSFKNFLAKAKRVIIANLSDKNTFDTLKEFDINNKLFFPPVIDYSKNLIDFPLKISGRYNKENASAAFNLALNLELNPEKVRQSLKNFPGIGRRMEPIGQINSTRVFSDFAHHPTAIKVAVEELSKTYPDKNIWIIYQPHMFSRTKALFKEFTEVFSNLKVKGVEMLPIYPSREKDEGIIKTQDLIKAVKKRHINYSASVEKAFKDLKPKLSEKDILVFMGAGDIDGKARQLIKKTSS